MGHKHIIFVITQLEMQISNHINILTLMFVSA